MHRKTTEHKISNKDNPALSIILLDWSCREHFQALTWLNKQNVDRSCYELIWVELYDNVAQEALELADAVITCHQKGIYHKHKGYNDGLLKAKGKLITICDSDAIFPENFVESILASFNLVTNNTPKSLVLMHYQWRTKTVYPPEFQTLSAINNYEWEPLWPNVGACMTVTKRDAILYGGFDEDKSYRGYMCGPYDLGWRMVNAGIPEIWHDSSVALWHFSHPNPAASLDQKFTWKLWLENTCPHIEYHAKSAVIAFSTGQILPLTENLEIYTQRMNHRIIGTKYEERYATFVPKSGFTKMELFKSRATFYVEPIKKMSRQILGISKK